MSSWCEKGWGEVRLIDADALNARLQKQVGSPTSDDLYEVNLCIIEAPTIAAIPVEWIEAHMDAGMAYYAPAAKRLLFEAWEKEQEAR